MRELLKIAFLGKQHRTLILLTILAMFLLTLANQLEVITMGILTRKGPDFFELFAPVVDGTIQKKGIVNWKEMEGRWTEVAGTPQGPITVLETNVFMSKYNKSDLLEKVLRFFDEQLHLNSNLKNLAIFLVFVAIFKATTLFFQRFSSKLIAIKVSADLRKEFFQHIQSLPMTFYQQHPIGSLSSRAVGDATVIAEGLNSCLVNYLQTPFTVVSSLALCFAISWELSLIIFFGFPMIVYPIIFLARRVKRVARQLQKNQEVFTSVLIDFLAGIQTVKVFSMEDYSLKKYEQQNDQMAALERKSARYDLSSRPIIHTIGMFFLATVLMYGLYVLEMKVSEVIVYCGLLYVFYEPIKKFAEENYRIQRGVAAAERMQEVLKIKENVENQSGGLEVHEFKHSIVFEDVWFKYEDEWVLKGVSFTIKKGEMIALVGPTGSGKSTIAQLLPRLYEVSKGRILVDGEPISNLDLRSLRELYAFVPQRPFLFLDTVACNISFGRPFTQSEIERAAKDAQADEFIKELPQGYDTELSESGKNLSGGQQQRLAIARAFVKKAPILVLDEATSSLDAISEYKIKVALQDMRGKLTQIIIAHRLTTIEDSDRIIYIEKGEVIAEGTKDELILSCPSFKIMWEILQKPKERQSSEK